MLVSTKPQERYGIILVVIENLTPVCLSSFFQTDLCRTSVVVYRVAIARRSKQAGTERGRATEPYLYDFDSDNDTPTISYVI